MNALELFISKLPHDENDIMDILQMEGVISDNCILACDVSDSDCVKAIEFLKK